MALDDVAHSEQFIDKRIQEHLGIGTLAELNDLIASNYIDNVVASASPTFFHRFFTFEKGNIAFDFDTK